MKITFFSNHLTHHQLPFCQELVQMEGVEFAFVADSPLPGERLTLGYEDMNTKYPFVICAYQGAEAVQRAQALANESDIVIAGSNSMKYLKQRLRDGKLTLRYTERIMKTPYRGFRFLKFAYAQRKIHGGYPSMYLLAASAFAPLDYKKVGLFVDKAYRWGYFPAVQEYEDIDALMDRKVKNSILWCGRLIDWKHPEAALEVAKRLRDEGRDFQLNMIGCGDLEQQLRECIQRENLQDRVHMLGSMPPEQVRRHMEAAEVFLFTSDRNEGWGAVLNESMNSACAVVASHMIGAVPFVIQQKTNGIIYRDGDIGELYKYVKWLLDHPGDRRRMGLEAYRTMVETWNAKTAAKRLLDLCEQLQRDPKGAPLFESGPCSKAEILSEDTNP